MPQIEGDRNRTAGGIDLAGVEQLNRAYQALIDCRRRRPEIRKAYRRAYVSQRGKYVAGPCAALKFPGAVVLAASAGVNLVWIGPGTALRGVRSRGESCAKAAMLNMIVIAAAAAREV